MGMCKYFINKAQKSELEKIADKFVDISVDNISSLVRYNEGKYIVWLRYICVRIHCRVSILLKRTINNICVGVSVSEHTLLFFKIFAVKNGVLKDKGGVSDTDTLTHLVVRLS